MKKDIHPDYRQVVFLDVSSDFKVLTRSTVQASETVEWEDGKEYPVVRFDLSSASHAFYTGKEQQLNDRGGRIQSVSCAAPPRYRDLQRRPRSDLRAVR